MERYLDLNLGSGRGTSVGELIKLAAAILKSSPIVQIESRRIGDPNSLIADISKAKRLLRWSPQHTLSDSISSVLEVA